MPVDPVSSELLLAIARRPLADPRQVARLAASVSDWDPLLALAREHRVLPLLAGCLAVAAASVPPAAQHQLRAEFDRNALQSLANAAELLAVLRLFDQAGIAALPFKGVVLAASAWGDLTTRPAGDLDVLIDRRDLIPAAALLRERGFQLHTPARDDGSPAVDNYFEYHFQRPADGLILELRWRLELTHARYRHDLGLAWAWPSRRLVTLAGAPVPGMSPEIALLVLCLHGCRHIWSRLIWICDVAQLLASAPSLDWRLALREARRTGLVRALALGVLLAHQLAGAEPPPAILRRFQRDRPISRMAQHIRHTLFDAPGSPPPGRVPYNLQLLSPAHRLRLALSLDFFRPNERDRALLPLPKPLHPLYYLLRPLRILRDRSARP